MTPSRCRLAAALALAAATAACRGPVDPSQNQSQQFTGSVQPNSAGPLHAFAVPNTGEFSVTVNSMSPGNALLGIVWGQPNGGACANVFGQQNVVTSSNLGRTVLSGAVTLKGQYCVQLFDPVGYVTVTPLLVAQNYTVTVNHP